MSTQSLPTRSFGLSEDALIALTCEMIADAADRADDDAFDDALSLEVARYDVDPTGGAPSRY